MTRALLTGLLALLLMVTGTVPASADALRELNWAELIPADAPPEPPPLPLHAQTLADALAAAESGPAALQQSPAAPVVQALDGQRIKLPGYVVPLDVNEDGNVTTFLFVPYLGACIHVPPPPSNQIVYIEHADGVRLDALYQPFWVEGTLHVEATHSELAQAGYRMRASKLYPYDPPD